MRRILQSSRRSPSDDARKRRGRLYGHRKPAPSADVPKPASGILKKSRAPPKEPRRVFGLDTTRPIQRLTRTRSASDLIREKSKRRAFGKRREAPNSSSSSSSDEETDSSGRPARPPARKEVRYIKSESFVKETCSIIGEGNEEEEEASTDVKPPACKTTRPGDEQCQHSSPPPPVDISAKTPVSRSLESDPEQGLPVVDAEPGEASTVVSTISNDFTRYSNGVDLFKFEEQGDENTSTTSALRDSEVDVEYLEHENDLLKDSLEKVVAERDMIAQDNWRLQMEVAQLRSQMQYLTTTGVNTLYYPTSHNPLHCSVADFENLLQE
jgi:hypothetical protein